MDTLFGGGEQKSTATSASGWELLPPEIQNAFATLAAQASRLLNTDAASRFTPLGETAGETDALSALNKGFAPTATSLNDDLSMLSNPYDESVVSGLNREAAGAGSILAGLSSGAGQVGGKYSSNRGFLSANDIDTTRLDQIGRFKQDQFNRSLDHALVTLPTLRTQDAANKLQAGGFQRNLALQKSTAPVSALSAIAQVLGILPSSGGATSTSTGSGSNRSGIFGQVNPVELFG